MAHRLWTTDREPLPARAGHGSPQGEFEEQSEQGGVCRDLLCGPSSFRSQPSLTSQVGSWGLCHSVHMPACPSAVAFTVRLVASVRSLLSPT